jgi:aryl-alcohol dehydrogenase-like predicted oxidoreductase
VLSGKIKPGHQFNEGDTRADLPYYSDKNIAQTNAFLEKIKPLADAKNATISQLVIRWTIEQPGITIALVGARNTSQAIDNAKAAEIALNPEEIAFINSELEKLQLEF